ncbi:MAG: biopolymer transporter ExbD [Isosphaeraceae bacterium]
MVGRLIRFFGLLAWAFVPGRFAPAQEFGRLEGHALDSLPDRAEAVASLTIEQLAAMPTPFRDIRSPVVAVRTDRGNWARLVVAPAFRKPAAGEGEPIPVAIVERFDTFESPGARNRLAQGRNLTLFAGLPIDLDSGQIVPQGEGGDLQFLIEGGAGPRLAPIAPARMYALEKSPIPPDAGPRPASGRVVRPDDFHGRYRLFANGQWSGQLDLSIRDGDVSGSFRSDQTGTSYPVAGQVGSPSNRIQFSVTLPRTRLDYEGYLFTDGKGAIAGTLKLLDRPYGFFAIRERGTISPEGEEADSIASQASRPPVFSIVLEGGKVRREGRDLDDEALDKALADASKEEAAVLVSVAADEPYRNVERLTARIRGAGLDAIRLKVQEGPR